MCAISILATNEQGLFGRVGLNPVWCKKKITFYSFIDIELNPVRAGMVKQPSDYSWSGYQINALGKESNLCTAHPLYIALANDSEERRPITENYLPQLFPVI